MSIKRKTGSTQVNFHSEEKYVEREAGTVALSSRSRSNVSTIRTCDK